MKSANKSILFFIILCLSNLILISCSEKQIWNYIKEGSDWPVSCKVENEPLQSPIDIAQPFTYKSKLI